MSSDLNSLYTELIFEHDKRPQHAGLRDPHQAEVHHVNPTCGDEIVLRVQLEAEHGHGHGESGISIADISYEATGCAMSRASASMMAELLIGTGLQRSREIHAAFDTAMNLRTQADADLDLLGDAAALMGAAKFPGRIKCVRMAWKAHTAAMAEALTRWGTAAGREAEESRR